MKKFIPAAALILIAFLFNGCSTDLENNEDVVLFEQIQGKWKLTEYHTDVASETTVIDNGYEIQFNADKTFTSNEENGYTGGTYKVIKSPGKNIQLIYKKNWSAKVAYKYINGVYDDNLFVQASSLDAVPDDMNFLDGYTLTRIP